MKGVGGFFGCCSRLAHLLVLAMFNNMFMTLIARSFTTNEIKIAVLWPPISQILIAARLVICDVSLLICTMQQSSPW